MDAVTYGVVLIIASLKMMVVQGHTQHIAGFLVLKLGENMSLISAGQGVAKGGVVVKVPGPN